LQEVTFDEPRHRAIWHRLTGPVIRGEETPLEKLPEASGAPSVPASRQAEPGCLLIALPLAPVRSEIEQWVKTQLGWQLAAVESVEIDFPSGNDEAFARLAATFATAPRWLIAVPAPFTAYTAFAQFVERMRQADAQVPRDGFLLVVTLDAERRPASPAPQWAGYWRDFVQAELAGSTTFLFTT
jgi:hypothetical protein